MPAAAHAYAVAQPVRPPPTTTTSAVDAPRWRVYDGTRDFGNSSIHGERPYFVMRLDIVQGSRVFPQGAVTRARARAARPSVSRPSDSLRGRRRRAPRDDTESRARPDSWRRRARPHAPLSAGRSRPPL